MNRTAVSTAVFLILAFAVTGLPAEETTSAELQELPFTDEFWVLARAEVLEVDGRQALVGTAFAKEVELQNGVLEVDVKVPDRSVRSYPGFVFRAVSSGDNERVYIRPHRAPMYDDAVQYTAVFNGVSAWQLDAGEGSTAATTIPTDEWFTLRLEINGTRARVSLDGTPVLEVAELRHGDRSGSFGLYGPTNQTAYFANFRWASRSSVDLGPANPVMTPPGLIREWQISQPLAWSNVNPHELPDPEVLAGIEWTPVTGPLDGMVDIAQYISPTVAGPPTVIAKTTISSETDRIMPLRFGYSDRITVFLNRVPVFRGISDYRSRDSGFLGAVGLNDLVFLPLEKGDNELLLQITETFGGWGFICQEADAIGRADGVTVAWRSPGGMTTPESALWDPDREVLYVSVFDAFTIGRGRGQQHLSRLSVDGEVLDDVWVQGLSNPSGLAWRDGSILVVERSGLAIIDPEKAEVVERILIPSGRLLNDIVVADDGSAFVSDSNGRAIYRVGPDNVAEKWFDLTDFGNPNGLTISGEELLVGLNPSHKVVAVDLENLEHRDWVTLPDGLVDGLEVLPGGDLLVSFGQGWLIRAAEDGTLTTIFDSSAVGQQAGDIELVAAERRVYIPTYYDGHVTAIELPEGMLSAEE